jgi:hypothetical protein
MSRPRAIALALAVLLVASCVRSGFDPVSGVVPQGDGTESEAADHRYDTCDSPYVLDMNQVPLTVTINTTGAKDDYQLECCKGAPDIALRMENLNSNSFRLTCTGGGKLWMKGPLMVCPPVLPLCFDLACDGKASHGFAITETVGHAIVCRDPAQGPAELVVTPQ